MKTDRFFASHGMTGESQDGDSDRQKGQSLILVAVALVVLVLFAAIAVDASDGYFYRRTAQNAADAAALAGGRSLAQQASAGAYDGDAIKASMNGLAEQNDIPDTDGTPANAENNNVVGYYLDQDGNHLTESPIGTPGGDALAGESWGVEAVTYITAPTFFGGIIGLDGIPVQASAAVMLQGACAASCVVPISAYKMNFSGIEGQCYKVWNGSGPGNFGWLNWVRQNEDNCTCSATCTEYNLNPDTCRSGLISVGDYIASDSGVSNASGIRDWLDYYRGVWPEIHPPVPFTVPVWDEVLGGAACNPNGQAYRVAGFAKVQLIAYKLSGGPTHGDVPEGCIELEPPCDLDDPDYPNCCDPDDNQCKYKDRNWIAVSFIEWVEGLPGNCDPYGSLLVPRLVR